MTCYSGAPVVVKQAQVALSCRLSGTVKGINRPCNDVLVNSINMANMLGLFKKPIVQYQNVLLTYAIACTLVQARNFSLLLLLLLLSVF